uniref:four helix bundle protein n=1 Tax=Dulcicalothrix desertica TaxID=32056 RepID=UPI002278EBA7|nr:four helix bundle protein [Dulcicalothrix desertica]
MIKWWQKGISIAEKCYFLTKSFPRDELYGMVQQSAKICRIYSSQYRRGLWKKVNR